MSDVIEFVQNSAAVVDDLRIKETKYIMRPRTFVALVKEGLPPVNCKTQQVRVQRTLDMLVLAMQTFSCK